MKKNHIIPLLYFLFTLCYIALLHRSAPKANLSTDDLSFIFDWMGHFWVGYVLLVGIILTSTLWGKAVAQDEVYQQSFTLVLSTSFFLLSVGCILVVFVAFIN